MTTAPTPSDRDLQLTHELRIKLMESGSWANFTQIVAAALAQARAEGKKDAVATVEEVRKIQIALQEKIMAERDHVERELASAEESIRAKMEYITAAENRLAKFTAPVTDEEAKAFIGLPSVWSSYQFHLNSARAALEAFLKGRMG